LHNFDLFFISTKSFIFLEILIFSLVFFAMILGKQMVEGKWRPSWNMLYFLLIFSVVAPFWLLKAIYNTIISKKPAWR